MAGFVQVVWTKPWLRQFDSEAACERTRGTRELTLPARLASLKFSVRVFTVAGLVAIFK